MSSDFEIKVWMQLFFEDGSVSQGMRVPAEWLDDPKWKDILRVTKSLLEDVNRDEGWLLVWGAGNMEFNHYPTSFSSQLAEVSSSSA